MNFKSEVIIDDEQFDRLEQPNIIINRECYRSLLADRDKLAALEQCGVDNWSGWDDAMVLLEEWNEQ